MKKFLIALVVVVGLLVAADFGARALAESRAGEALAQRAGVTTAPEVDVRGFPFLTQAIAGEYEHVTVSLADAELGGVPMSGTVELYGVILPLSEVLSGSITSLAADRSTVVARIPSADFVEALGLPGIRLSAGPVDAVRISTTVTVGAQTFPVVGDATVAVVDGTLSISAQPSEVGDTDISTVPKAVASAATAALSVSIPLTGLPVDIQTAEVAVDGTDVVITATTGAVEFQL